MVNLPSHQQLKDGLQKQLYSYTAIRKTIMWTAIVMPLRLIIVFINDNIIWPNYHKWLEDLKDTFQEGLEVTPEQLHGGF